MLNEVQVRKGRRQGDLDAPVGSLETSAAPSAKIGTIGVWIEGVERLGVAYEGVWRVLKRFLLSSQGSRTNFLFVAPARFEKEIDEFVDELPSELRRNVRIRPLGDQSNKHERGEAVRHAGHANHLDVDAWLVPNPMWAAAKHLIKPKVVWFHDFLLAEFPQSYPRNLFETFRKNVRDLADAGAFFVFLSPHVKQRHGHEVCGISPDRSMLIVTPALDASDSLAGLPCDPEHGGDLIRSELRNNLKSWCTPVHADLFYHHISSYPFESVPYFFVSSQNREHKGFLRLAQIHASMLRDLHMPYSIFTTALVDLTGASPLEQFLTRELLMGDFMSVGKVSDLTHALLYKFARMTIHPSTFEGNLPLPFAESVSVGTPCIMPYSRAYLDLVDAQMHPWIFYSPTKMGLISKIQEVESARPDFIAAQKQIVAKLRSYSLHDYFDLQMKAFERSARMQPEAVQLFLHARAQPQQFLRRRSLGEIFGSAPRTREVEVTADRILQARIWREFDLSHAEGKDSAERPVMHWAAYLGKEHPREESYFVISVRDASAEIESRRLRLGAEIGTWIDDEYVIADHGEFQFGSEGELPGELLSALKLIDPARSFNRPGSRIGWLKLGWRIGLVPEIRVSGTPVPKGSKAVARLACLTGFERPFAFPSPPETRPAPHDA
jgi:hypothetical protein